MENEISKSKQQFEFFKSMDEIDVARKIGEKFEKRAMEIYVDAKDKSTTTIELFNYANIKGAEPNGGLGYLVSDGGLKLVKIIWRDDFNFSEGIFADLNNLQFDSVENLEQVVEIKDKWKVEQEKEGSGKAMPVSFQHPLQDEQGYVAVVRYIGKSPNIFFAIKHQDKFQMYKL